MKNILITGGAGFIGSHVVRKFVKEKSEVNIINIDALTYAGNLENLVDIEGKKNYIFEKVNINDINSLRDIFKKYYPDAIIHLAAESHVDRSITDPNAFVNTNILGTVNLLNLCREFWFDSNSSYKDVLNKRKNIFYHISTDEVYGSLGQTSFFTEATPYAPKSPYSASKAASDHLVRAFGNTYSIPFVISNCSNNYGPNQFPEKLVPLCINNILNEKPLPIYGNGEQIRDWLFVVDHAKAIYKIFYEGEIGETYNIGGSNEWKNIDLVKELIKQMDFKLGKPKGYSKKFITFVKDRLGHDTRYAIDSTKLYDNIGWKPSVSFEEGLSKTIDWYLENKKWLENINSYKYKEYYEKHYI